MMGTNDYDNADYVGVQNFVGVSRLSSKTIQIHVFKFKM